MIKDWICGKCRKRILGKIHDGQTLIIQYKGSHHRITGNFELISTCPYCGAENYFTQKCEKLSDNVITSPGYAGDPP